MTLKRATPWIVWLSLFGVWEYLGLRESGDERIPFSQLLWWMLNWPVTYALFGVFFAWFIPHVFTEGNEFAFYRRVFAWIRDRVMSWR